MENHFCKKREELAGSWVSSFLKAVRVFSYTNRYGASFCPVGLKAIVCY
jgi:hypothetical protein